MVARKHSFGGITACRIHDLLRVLCLKKAKEDKFLEQIYKKGDSFSPFNIKKHRRLFFGRELSQKFRGRNLDYFLIRDFFRYIWNEILSPCCHSSRMIPLVCIDLTCNLRDQDDMMMSLFFACCLPCLPLLICIENAHDSLGMYTIKLPRDIFKMVELRHLHSKKGVFKYHFSHLSSKKAARLGLDNSSKLDSLQTLHRICTCKDCRSFLLRAPNLRKLGFFGELISQESVLMLPDLEFLKCLETLSFTNLRCFGERIESSTLSAGLKLPPTITRLIMKDTLLKWEELSILLQTLPNLEVLKLLKDACGGRVWNTNELEGFFQLKYLRFEELNIVEWNASEDQFPRLEVLVLERCYKLKRIPIDFGNLNELRVIKLEWCTKSAEDSAKEILEEQRNKKGDDDCLPLLVVGHNYYQLITSDDVV